MEKKRYDVTLTKSGERTQNTHTWAASQVDAYARMAEQMTGMPGVWDGWKCTVHPSGVETLTDEVRVMSAVAEFAEVWGGLIETLPHDYGCTLTCGEAEAAAALFRAIGDEPTAGGILDAHADHDDRGDAHYKGARTED